MKMKAYKNTSALVALSILILLTACDKKEAETELDVFKKQIAIGWKIKSATLDGVDVISYYPNLNLVFTSSTLSSTNGVLPLWKPSVNFTIEGSTSPYHIVTEDGFDFIVVSVDDSSLVLEFQYDAVKAGGRVQSISGNYHFEFVSR